MVWAANSHLESNPIPARNTQKAETNRMCTTTQGPHRDWDWTVFEPLLWRYGSEVDCHRDRGSGCRRLGYGISLLFFFFFKNYFYVLTLTSKAFFFFFFICGEFCHTLKWNSHGFTCVPHPDPPSHLPLHRLPLGFPSAPRPRACLMHPTWAGDLFHPR